MYQHTTTSVKTRSGRMGRRVIQVKQAVPGECPQADIRHDLVARIRAEIAAGTYDTPEKMEIALGLMIEDVE